MVYKPKAQQSGGSLSPANYKKPNFKKQKSELKLELDPVKQETEILDASDPVPSIQDEK